MNIKGLAFYEVESLSVNEWYPPGQGKPEQVHLWLDLEGFPHPLVMRFRSPQAVDELIVALMTHRKGVWG